MSVEFCAILKEGKMAAGSSNNGGVTTSASGCHSHGHRRQESMYAMTGLYSESASNEEDLNESDVTVTTTVSLNTTAGSSTACYHDTVVKCHSRNPSAGVVDRQVPISVVLCDKYVALFCV